MAIDGKSARRVANSGYSYYGGGRVRPAVAGWLSSSKSAAEDISQNLDLMRERSRDLYAGGGPLGRGAIDRVVLNAVGPGLALNCRVGADILGLSDDQAAEFENQVEYEFALWSESKDASVDRQLNFYELQALAFKSVLINGDALVALAMLPERGVTYDLRVKLIEGDRLREPDMRPPNAIIDGGVELDRAGVPVAYWIANRHPLAEQLNQPLLEYFRVPAFGTLSGRRNVLHLLPLERIGQHRGVPFLAPVLEILKQLARYTDAELMAALIGGMFSVFFEHQQNEDDAPDEAVSEALGDAFADQVDEFRANLMNGTVMDLPPGVSASSVQPTRPNDAFEPFVAALCRQLGAAVGVPAELLLLNFTASYSASRAALLEAWKLFSYWRCWWSDNFCTPIYHEFLREAILKGRVDAPGYFEDAMKAYAYGGCEWTGPSQGQLDPVKEVTAAALRVENGFSTRQRETAELTGGDFELNYRQLAKEERMRSTDRVAARDVGEDDDGESD